MILIVTNKIDPHADVVISHLTNESVPVFRFNTEDFPQKILFSWKTTQSAIDGVVKIPKVGEVKLSQIKSCWYRRPEPSIISSDLITEQAKEFAEDESKVLLKGLWKFLSDRFWINYPSKIREAESKLYNLKLASKIGFFIPRTLITNNSEEVKDFFKECKGEIINKVLGKGQVEYLKDYYFVYAHKISLQDLEKINSVVYSPTFFQEYIPKSLEIRVTVVGKKIFSCEIHSQDSEKTREDWRQYDFDNVLHRLHKLPRSIEILCLKMMENLELNFSTFDLILTPDNKYVFLELNPNGQWLWIENLTGLPISEAVAELLVKQGRD